MLNLGLGPVAADGAAEPAAMLSVSSLQLDGPTKGSKGLAMILPITEWHAHVYYDRIATRDLAEAVREAIGAEFSDAILGRWHDQPVGPHSAAMYQVAFAPPLFPTLVPWLALYRRGLSVLLHPDTGYPRADHLSHALWLGSPLPLKAELLPE